MVNEIEKKSLKEEFFDAVNSGDVERVIDLFIKEKIDVNKMRDDKGWYAMHLAVMNNDVNMIVTLRGLGADIDPQNEKFYGETPLYLAMDLRRKISTIETLLALGAKPGIEMKHGLNAYDVMPKEPEYEAVLRKWLPQEELAHLSRLHEKKEKKFRKQFKDLRR
ncbi:MAG: ankyrin repeat domain-containing protein [Candidatus Micrarchaeaceae archaeon]